jgi:translation initiation factor IF-3
MNEMITAREVFLIDQDGTKIGNTPFREALVMAQEAVMDLVEIVPNAEPPVCKIMDYGKHKYQEQKKAAEARKKQKIVEVKEIKMRPNIDDHDYDVKMKAILRFFEEGDKVKLTLRFRGRELSHTDIGMKVLERIQEDIKEVGKVELYPKVEGRQAIMIIAPVVVAKI